MNSKFWSSGYHVIFSNFDGFCICWFCWLFGNSICISLWQFLMSLELALVVCYFCDFEGRFGLLVIEKPPVILLVKCYGDEISAENQSIIKKKKERQKA